MKFTAEQNELIAVGKKLAEELQRTVTVALGLGTSKVEVKRHAYIYSPPGAGKTFTVQAMADKHGVQLVKVQGASSLNAFVTQMAVSVYLRPADNIIVWIDDCDGLFITLDGLNVMKGALDQQRNSVSWNKNMTVAINSYLASALPADNIRGEALRKFQSAGGVGVSVPTDRVRFLITSNKNLIEPSGNLKTEKKMHEAAIRDRVTYRAFNLTSKQSWGWIAHVLLTNDVLGLSVGQKQELLCWMFDNWEGLPATSMRAVKDYGAAMLNEPASYRDQWDLTLMGATS